MMTMKKKRLIFITTLLVIVFITLTIALVVLAKNTNLFKSQDVIVKEYIGQVFDRIIYITDFDYDKEIYSSLDNSIYESNTEIILNNENKKSKLKLISDTQVDNIDNYKYNYTKLSYGEENIAEVEYIEQDDIMGIRLTNLIKQFISVKNENLDDIAENLESLDKETYNFPEKIEEINLSKEITFSQQEEQILKDKYLNIVVKNLAGKEIKTQKDATVTIEKQKINANSHILNVNRLQLNKIYIEILENLKNDEIILNKISNIEKVYQDYILNQDEIIKDYYVNEIDILIEKIKNDQNDYQIKFNLYEKDGNVVKINIEHEMRKLNINLLNENKISINDLIMGEEENSKEINIIKSNGEIQIKAEILKGEEKNILDIAKNIIETDDKIKMEINIIHTNANEKKKSLEIKNSIRKLEEIQEKYDIEENNIILNELDEQKLNVIINKVVEIIKKEFPNRIRTLQDALEVNISDDMVISEDGKTEKEKNVFNAKFSFYSGENVSKENVKVLFNIIKQNLEQVEIINNNLEIQEDTDVNIENLDVNQKVKFKIKDKSNYEDSLAEVEKILDESNTYKVEIEYNKDTDIIEYIIISPNKN